jgi:hypothetical protein
MRVLTTVALIFISLTYNSFSQFLSGKNAQILVKGIIKDDNTQEPFAVNIEFRSADGKKIKTQSNSSTGIFEQLLPAGEKFTAILSGDKIIRKEINLITDNADSYKEQKVEWTVVSPKPGVNLFSGEIFKQDSEKISDVGIETLKEIQMTLRFNRSLHVAFEVNAPNNLANHRIKELEQIVSSWVREKSRIEFKHIDKSQSNKDLFVKITKIEDFLNK